MCGFIIVVEIIENPEMWVLVFAQMVVPLKIVAPNIH